MPPDEYVKALDKALADLASRIQQRDLINAEIAGLKETVRVLSNRVPLTDELQKRVAQLLLMLDYATPTLSDSIRSLLTRKHPSDLTAIEVRNALEKIGFDFDDFSNPLSACHTVLKRMLADKEVELGTPRDGKPTYRRVLKIDPPKNPGLRNLEMMADLFKNIPTMPAPRLPDMSQTVKELEERQRETAKFLGAISNAMAKKK